MKVKRLWVSYIKRGKMEKMVIVKESSFSKKVLQYILNSDSDEYKCVFTNRSYFLGIEQIVPITMFLDSEQLKTRISKRNLRKFYQENEDKVKIKLLGKPKREIGFKGDDK